MGSFIYRLLCDMTFSYINLFFVFALFIFFLVYALSKEGRDEPWTGDPRQGLPVRRYRAVCRDEPADPFHLYRHQRPACLYQRRPAGLQRLFPDG